MTGWEPATEAEVAMRDALRAQDQELYFRILTRVDLLLPVSAQALAGQAPMGWGTWSTGGRTHVLAFTSATALRACLGESAGTSRRIAFADLAADWPNHEWWLAVNPGLPIEGYLPAWFVAQLSRGDVRLPGRTMGARARLARAETAARAQAGTTASGQDPAPAPGAPVVPAPGRSVPIAPGEPSTVPPTAPTAPARSPVQPTATPPSLPPAAAAPTRPPTPAERQPDPPAADQPLRVPASARVTPIRPTEGVGDAVPARRADGPAEVDAAPPRPAIDTGAGRPGGPGTSLPAAERGGSRSFFEPASGGSLRRGSPLDQPYRAGERAVPPSLLGRGGQPFPRRRPLNEPVPEEPTRAFRFDPPAAETTQALPHSRPESLAEEPTRAIRVDAPAEETTRALAPPRREPVSEEPTRAIRVTGPAAGDEATQALPRRRPPSAEVPEADQRTEQLPGPSGRTAHFAAPEQPEELPPSIAEPVSGPPAQRRTFSPIVIEGTVIESRDLTETEAVRPAARTPWAERPPRTRSAGTDGVAPEPSAVPTAPAASAQSAASATPTASPVDEEPTAPQAGSAATVLPAAEQTVSLGAERTVSLGAERTVSLAARDVPATPRAGQQVPVEAARPASADAVGPTPAAGSSGREEPAPADFVPANEVEEDLLGAAGSGSTDSFLSTLLLARVLLPIAPDSAPGSRPGEPGFVWRTEELDGEPYVVVYTSPERLAERADGPVETVRVKFVQLIRRWPDETWSFAVNPGTPVGAKYPGEQIIGLANWAAEVGLGDDPESEPEPPAAAEPASARQPAAAPDPTRPVTMQKAVAPSQLAYYLERGYDRVSGFVHRASELAHLTTPEQLYDALGLGHPDSPFSRDAEEIYVIRWPAHRPSLYRIPYGGQNEAAMRAMEGWVIERPPFRGNGFAPGESSDVVAEFKVDSARLPHGAQLWRIGADGTERVIAILDSDALLWRQVGEA
ncbi:SseB protein N-terminal domain-containing protein [Micromonospora rhizosphaerae]|uniref:SseB protein N-terminal domain-containing protein n=1 Tax=Micromonospora rhizosphaerae TaxID=568872 RepID=A0A1C6RJQ1_9ACTN|nr:SseB family protein [Micromonospora rhizosphaerae]SCL17273.1 SseB protein N-terminal domain-containing protein [Micromonospora rhizosphaerae]